MKLSDQDCFQWPSEDAAAHEDAVDHEMTITCSSVYINLLASVFVETLSELAVNFSDTWEEPPWANWHEVRLGGILECLEC